MNVFQSVRVLLSLLLLMGGGELIVLIPDHCLSVYSVTFFFQNLFDLLECVVM